MLIISNSDKLIGYNDDILTIQNIVERDDINEYQISAIYDGYNYFIITINRIKRKDVDPKFPMDKTPVYNTKILQQFSDGARKIKELGIKKKALESSDNMIKAIKEMLDDFINER